MRTRAVLYTLHLPPRSLHFTPETIPKSVAGFSMNMACTISGHPLSAIGVRAQLPSRSGKVKCTTFATPTSPSAPNFLSISVHPRPLHLIPRHPVPAIPNTPTVPPTFPSVVPNLSSRVSGPTPLSGTVRILTIFRTSCSLPYPRNISLMC